MFLYFLFLFIRFKFTIPGIGTTFNFTQKLDHFDALSKATFNQVAEVNLDYYNSSSPRLIFYISGEQTLNTNRINNGPLLEFAKRSGSLISSLEHRFFGSSVPVDLTTDNLKKYLTTAQALEDIAVFIKYLKERYCKDKSDCPLTIVGGSYAGTVSSIFRMKYPHLANFSWSSSPPLIIKNDFWEYDDHVADVIKKGYPKCYENSVKMIKQFENWAQNPESKEYKLFREKIGLKRSTYPASAMSIIADFYAEIVQYDSRLHTLRDVCEHQNNNEPDYESFYNDFKKEISDPDDGDDLLLTETSKDMDPEYINSRSWLWMTCNEYGWYQTASGRFRSQMVNLNYSKYICQHVFGVDLPKQNNLLRRYNIDSPKQTLTIFTNGLIDPWSRLSIKKVDPTLQQHLYLIEGASHCSDLSAMTNFDSEDLIQKRKEILQTIIDWQRGKCKQECLHGECILEKCICTEGWYGDFCKRKINTNNQEYKIFSSIVVLLPTLMVIVIGIGAWKFFKNSREDHEIRTIPSLIE